MKKSKIVALAAAFSLTLTTLPMLVMGDEKLYDPENDPLVSLSYINDVVKPEYEAKITELSSQIKALNSTVIALNDALNAYSDKIAELEASGTSGGQYEVVYMQKGAKLLALTPCEIILRSGTAITVSITANGLNNITDGTELLNSEEVPLYNSLLVPRGNDGRGIQVTSDEAYVMVRGDYQIVN